MQVEIEHAELQEQYDDLLTQCKWLHAILGVILEEQGGVVKLDRETIENYDLTGQFKVWSEEDTFFVALGDTVD